MAKSIDKNLGFKKKKESKRAITPDLLVSKGAKKKPKFSQIQNSFKKKGNSKEEKKIKISSNIVTDNEVNKIISKYCD